MKSLTDLMLDTGGLLDKSKKHLLTHIGRAIAVLTVVLAVILTFAEVTIVSDLTRRLTSEIAVLTVAAVLMYFAMQTEGELSARQTEEYRRQKEAARSAAEAVSADKILALSAYLERYIQGELSSRRRSLLYTYGYTEEDYAAYLAGARSSIAQARRIFRRARRMRPIHLSVGSLLCDAEEHESTLTSPHAHRGLLTISRLVPSLLGMLVTVSVIIEWHDPITLSVIMQGAVKLCALLSVGLKGYLDGHKYVLGALVSHLSHKSRLLHAFLIENA